MHAALKLPIVDQCTLFERAQATQNAAMARALAAHDPATGATVLELTGAIGIYLGEGHPLNQGLALGLGGECDDASLDALQALLGRGGHPVVVELTPGADADLGRRLARRGFFIRQFQQVWMREADASIGAPSCDPFVIRPAAPNEVPLFARLVMAGFMEQDELPPEGAPLVIPPLEAAGTTAWIAWHGERPVAGGTLGLSGDIAALSGTAVLPAFRGRGLQRALVRARVAAAHLAGARVAISATVPASASAANLARLGFRAAYPKVEMANG
jgi:GNAT superfamily N-acetyltransferase